MFVSPQGKGWRGGGGGVGGGVDGGNFKLVFLLVGAI